MTEERAVARTQATVPIVEGKGLMPSDMEGLWRISGIIAASGMAPKDMHGKPEAVFVACQMGLEVGMSIMASIQNIAIINGRPSIWGDSVLALVRASGKLKKFTETFEGEFPKDTFKAVCTALRDGDQEPTVREFAVADAKIAGLWDKVGPWKQYPKRMLQMRARSWALRDTFGDVLKGMRTAEEVMDYDVDMVPDNKGTYAPERPALSGTESLKAALKGGHKAPEKVEIPTAEETFASPEYQQEKEVNNVQSTDSSSNGTGDSGNEPWNPAEAELLQRYTAEKAQAIKECAEKMGIDPRGKIARVVHAEILEKAKAKPVDEAQLMLLEKYNELWVSASKLSKHWAQDSMDLADGERPPEDRIAEWVQLVEEYAANEERM
jgi:hypothetical protein